MKRTICLLLTLFLLFPCIVKAQSIFVDYVDISDIDQTAFWVLTDPNGTYRGGCTLALGEDPNAYVQDHMAEWLTEIYAMNADPNTPDWMDSHMGKFLAGINMINNISSLADAKVFMLKMFRALYPIISKLED